MSWKRARSHKPNAIVHFTWREVLALCTMIVHYQNNCGFYGNHIVEWEELESAYQKLKKVKNE